MTSTDLVPKYGIGDTSFSIRIAQINKPFGFYDFLGLPRDATNKQIRAGYRDLASKFHPDTGGKAEDFVLLENVVSTLLDDGGELGHKHSQRTHYDVTSALEEYFDGVIEYDGGRTKKLSEIALARMKVEKIYAEMRVAMSKLSVEEQQKMMIEFFEKLSGVTPEMLEFFEKSSIEKQERYRDKMMKFFKTLKENPSFYNSKILDLFYDGHDNVVFGTSKNFRLNIVDYEDKGHVFEMTMDDNCYIPIFSRVHFKAPRTRVYIINPNLKGIFHVMNGSVIVCYKNFPIDTVIRARAPAIKANAFEKRGDLFVPAGFSKESSWTRKPDLDIAVYEGFVVLQPENKELYSEEVFEKVLFDKK